MYSSGNLLGLFFILLFFCDAVFAKNRCVWATAKLVCKRNPAKADNVQVKLIDWDGGTFLDPDDDMGIAFSEEDGTVRVEGCGDDLMPWNDPDPYLKILHYCNSDKGQEKSTKIIQKFVPDTADFGTIILDA